MIYPQGSASPLPPAAVVRVTLRSDLTPIPLTIEIEARRASADAELAQGRVVRVGVDGPSFVLVKGSERPNREASDVRADVTRRVIGLLEPCISIARPLQRAVYREGASLGAIYRACGAMVRIDDDFTVPVWACYKGMLPSVEIAKALQEEAGALVVGARGRIAFRRLRSMIEGPAGAALREDATEAVESSFLEDNLLPWAFSTAADGSMVLGRREAARGVTYRPRADARVLANLGTALVLRRRAVVPLDMNLAAGMRVDVAGEALVVITAAHVFDAGTDGQGGQQSTHLWLGAISQ